MRCWNCRQHSDAWRITIIILFFFSSRRRHTRLQGDWSSDVCSSDLLDLRSEDPRALAQLDVTVRAALERAADDENRTRSTGTPPLRLEVQLVGDRPCGLTPRAHPLVQAAIAANRALGRDCELASASTDANAPIALGIPAIALGAGGKAGDAHLTTEWFENVEGALGIVRALLVTAAMAEVG